MKYYAVEYEGVELVRDAHFPLNVSVHRFDSKRQRDEALLSNWRPAAANDKLVLSARFFWLRSSASEPWPVRLQMADSQATPTRLLAKP